MDLKEYLTEYKALTLDIMERINIDGNIKFLLDEREKIINEIVQAKFDKSEIKSIGSSLKLMELENEMQKMVNVEKANLKKKIKQLKVRQQGNRQYMNINYSQYGMGGFDKKF